MHMNLNAQEALTADIMYPTFNQHCQNGKIDLHINGGFPPYDVVWKRVIWISPFPPFEWVIQENYGIQGNNDGEDFEDNIVEKIYSEFNDHVVNRVDGAGPIQYWGPNISTPGCWQTSQMLINLNGTCGGWAAFFEDVLRLQGIGSSEMSSVTYNDYLLPQNDIDSLENQQMNFFGSQNQYVMPRIYQDSAGNYIGHYSQFLVKNWNLYDSTNFVFNEYENASYGISQIKIVLNNGNVIPIGDQIGSIGQGNSDPRSEFENHAIVKYAGEYYDPSYGSFKQPNANSWETQALDGFGSVMVYYHNNQLYYVNWIGHLNNSSQQSNVSP